MAAARRLSLAFVCLVLGASCVSYVHYPQVVPWDATVIGPGYRGTVYATRPSGALWGVCGPLLPILPILPLPAVHEPGVGEDVFTILVHLGRTAGGTPSFLPGQVQLVVRDEAYAPTRLRVNNEEVLDPTAPVAVVDTRILLIFDGVEKPDDEYSLSLPGLPTRTFRMTSVGEWEVSILGTCQRRSN